MSTTIQISPEPANTHAFAEPRAAKARGAWVVALAAVTSVVAVACSTQQPTARSKSALDPTILGTAQSFAVLGGSTVTNTGATIVRGNLGVDPGLAITGFPPGLVSGGTVHSGDGVALQAQTDVTTAYNTLAAQALTADLTGQDLGGKTLTAGVYRFSSSAQLTGAVTLDAQGDPSAVFVFQMGSTLTTASNSSVLVLNGAQDCNIYWQVGSSATLGTTTAFKGSILALTSITLNTGATVSGRALARNAAVTMDSNAVSVQSCAASLDAGVDANGDSGSNPDSSDGSVDSSRDGSDGSPGVEASGDASGADSGDAGTVRCCGGVVCGASCANLNVDNANCGACGHACASDESCTAGACARCASVCGGACVDLTNDAAHCGSCGRACLATEQCTNGACGVCPGVCGGVCTPIDYDHANCGSCGNACLANEKCISAVCTPCATVCGGTCADLTADSHNCGSCGNVCAAGQYCTLGTCVCQ